MKYWIPAILSVLTAFSATRGEAPLAAKRELADIIGSSHVAGHYNFTDKDFLNEGADVVLGMGSRVIKLWFTTDPAKSYRFNSTWPEVASLVDLAKHPYYRKVFAKPFTTFILETFSPPRTDRSGQQRRFPVHKDPTPEDIEHEKQSFYEITRHLLTEYKRSNKTFILQNWESDWVLTSPGDTSDPDENAIKNMIVWLNARQDGVEKARAEVGMDGVMVAHAAEVNLIAKAMEGKRCATNDVLPHTHCDLYSYSAYDTCLKGAKPFRAALDHLAAKAPDSRLFGGNNIFVGEFGAPESSHDQAAIVKWTTEVSLEFGARYIIYWQVYCNELKDKEKRKEKAPLSERATIADLRGFWLIRPDGTKSPAYDYFVGLLRQGKGAASRPGAD